MFNFYSKYTKPEFIDDPEWFETKNSPEVIESEKNHYIMCFLLDLLQFIFQFVVTVKDE